MGDNNFENNNERLPLLGTQSSSDDKNEATSNVQDPKNEAEIQKVENNGYQATIIGDKIYITCKVCGSQIDITDKNKTYVVKCSECKEATPIKCAPPKRRYIRCSCNCLLICCDTATRIVCARENCKRVIELPLKNKNGNKLENAPSNTTINQSNSQYEYGIFCGNCDHRFTFSADEISNKKVISCPLCNQTTYIGNARKKANILFVTSLVLFLIFLPTFKFLNPKSTFWVIVLASIAFIQFCWLIHTLKEAISFCNMKISRLERNNV